jgi:hypothetical protein
MVKEEPNYKWDISNASTVIMVFVFLVE